MINTVLPNELIGANYKGHAIRSTVNLLVEAIGIEPSKYTSDLCEWYLQSNDLKFYLYCYRYPKKLGWDDVVWFRIGTYTNNDSIYAKDIIIDLLKKSY
jgi:hypothetical protein